MVLVAIIAAIEITSPNRGAISLTGVDSVGTVPSSLLTYAAAAALRPDLIINAGTAGGFQVSLYLQKNCRTRSIQTPCTEFAGYAKIVVSSS